MKKNLKAYTGLPEWAKKGDPLSHCYSSYTERSIERVQLDESVEACAETVDYLYGEFTPTRTEYARGSRPLLEMIVAAVCRGCRTDLEKAMALIRWRRANYRHVPKCGLGTEEEILLGGYSMCHDASRSFITLCQVAGLGARMIIGLNETQRSGHTLTEVYVAGGWAVFDPSPCLPWAVIRKKDGTLASGWDIRQDPSIMDRAPLDDPAAEFSPRAYAAFFANYRLANYSIEESTRNMAMRFVRLITAQKIVENYDYTGHLVQKPLALFADLDGTVKKWLAGTLANVAKSGRTTKAPRRRK